MLFNYVNSVKERKVKILQIEDVTHDVKRLVLEKPKGIKLEAGSAAELSINKPGWKEQIRPFTFSSAPEDKVLELTIKIYPEKKGVTNEMSNLKVGDEIILYETFPSYQYKGPGVFIAGGAGITPFLSILRHLHNTGKIDGNILIYSNKTHEDIINEHELVSILKDKCIFTLTREKRGGYENRRIDEKFLKEKIKNFNQPFYICGSPEFKDSIRMIISKHTKNISEIVWG